MAQLIPALLAVVNFIIANGPMFLAAFVGCLLALVALMHALIGLCMLIPGAEPEATLQKMVDKLQAFVDFISKFSKK